MVVFQGGIDPAGYSTDDLYVLDMTNERFKWHRVVVQDSVPGPRYGHAMDLVAQRFLVTVTGNDGMPQLVPVQMGCFCFVVEETLQARHYQMHMDYLCIEMVSGNGLFLQECLPHQGINTLRFMRGKKQEKLDILTKADCLHLVHDLLLPVIMKSQTKSTLSHQENRILEEIEGQTEKTLALVFENYKSLDESLFSGMMDGFRPATGSPAPALVPAIKLYTSLHDILSPEVQFKFCSYFQISTRLPAYEGR